MVDEATATIIRQPRTKGTDFMFTAPDEEVTSSMSPNQALLQRPIKTKQGPAPRH